MRLEDAQNLVTGGVAFGDVFEHVVTSDQELLKDWFVHSEALPNLALRSRAVAVSSGNLCRVCGGMLVRTGTCECCSFCGESSGCG